MLTAERKAGCPPRALLAGTVAHSGASLPEASAEVSVQELQLQHDQTDPYIPREQGRALGRQRCSCLIMVWG